MNPSMIGSMMIIAEWVVIVFPTTLLSGMVTVGDAHCWVLCCTGVSCQATERTRCKMGWWDADMMANEIEEFREETGGRAFFHVIGIGMHGFYALSEECP